MKITLQHIFNLAWKEFIVNEGKPSTRGQTDTCMYLNDEGRKCAVGLALPDGHPAHKSKYSFPNLVINYPELFDKSIIELDMGGSIEMRSLKYFQYDLHDRLIDGDGNWKYSLDERKEKYINVAKTYGLVVPT